MGKFSFLKRGDRFYIDGEPFVKTGDLTYDDAAGIERYIGPFEDAKIAVNLDEAKAVKKGKTDEEPEWITDPATRVMSRNPNFGKKTKKTKAPKKAKK
jgi:hypothetical protein